MKNSSTFRPGAKKKLIFYCAFMAWPMLQFAIFYIGVNFNSLLLSFKEIDVYDYDKFSFTLNNFINWFADPALNKQFTESLQVSLQVYLITLVVGVPLGLFFAYYIFKKMPLAGFFRVMLFLPSMLSAIVLVPIYVCFVGNVVPEFMKALNLESVSLLAEHRFATVMFYNVLVGFGTSVLMYSNKMTSISPEIIESAHLDGASGIKEFWHIVLPMAFPTVSVFLVTGVAGIFINQINAFIFFGTDWKSDIRTIGYLMYVRTYNAKQNISEYPQIAALGIILTLIAVPLTFLVRWLLNKFGPSED